MPRPGHPEGQVVFHIRDVLNNVDRFIGQGGDRPRLRLIALVHDTFKYQVDRSSPRTVRKSHGYWACKFGERYLIDPATLQVIELHDEAYRASRHKDREVAERRAEALIESLGDNLGLFLRFYLCDSRTGDKSMGHYVWFKQLVEARWKSSFKEVLDERTYL